MGNNMVFTSFQFLLFLIIVLAVYYMLPVKGRYLWLLAASYWFYGSAAPAYAAVLLGITVLCYGLAFAIQPPAGHRRSVPAGVSKGIFAAGVVLLLFLLAYSKHAAFAAGLSFIIFQAVSYLADVYRGELPLQKNPLKLALYLAFFPKLLSGPIERAGNIFEQMDHAGIFLEERFKRGTALLLLGLFCKVLLSDHLAAVIDPVLDAYTEYSGVEIALAVILYAFQIYTDFAGYSYMAMGCAGLFGYQLSDNFRAPYFAESVSEFWRRWHMTLNQWFRDYVYIPLGGSRRGKWRKCLNLFLVFLLSGLWHGAAFHFILWGALHGVYLVLEQFVRLPQNRYVRKFVTFILVDFAWIFFRMPDVRSVGELFRHAVRAPGIRELFSLQYLEIFGNMETFALLLCALLFLMALDDLQYRTGRSFPDWLFAMHSLPRWLVCTGMLMAVVFWGAYGGDYAQTQFIYFQF